MEHRALSLWLVLVVSVRSSPAHELFSFRVRLSTLFATRREAPWLNCDRFSLRFSELLELKIALLVLSGAQLHRRVDATSRTTWTHNHNYDEEEATSDRVRAATATPQDYMDT